MSSSEVKPSVLLAVTTSLTWNFYRGMLGHFQGAGCSVTMLSAPGKLLDEISTSEGATKIAIPMQREIRPVHDLVSLWKLYRAIKATRPDIVDVSTPKAGLLGGVAAVMARVPCRVYTLRGLRMETARGIKRRILWLAERIACACAQRVVPVSHSLQSRAIQLRVVSPEKIRLLGNGGSCGVDVERFNARHRNGQQANQLRQSFGLTGNETVIGFVGRLVKDKGVCELVEAFCKLSRSHNNLRLLLVGDFEPADPLPAEVCQFLESNPAVQRAGFVVDTAPYYALMDLLVLPTYREGFPCVSLEAQASQVPVVTTSATGAVDSVQDGITGFIVPVQDARALAQAIDTLLRNTDFRVAMGRVGRQWMEQEFRPERIWKARLELYREMRNDDSRNEKRLRCLWKRAFDVLTATAALILLSPFIAAIALLVRFFLGSPVLFRQVRAGYKGQVFTCLKFRSMTDQHDSCGRLLPDEMRLTALGHCLRSFSLDELPELINVLRGEMSLVGPRPLLMEYLPRYTAEQARRHDVKPGITGWAQVNGRNAASWEQKFANDVWYVDHQSLWLDLQIIVLTIWKTIKREGISQPGHATMPEFTGLQAQGNGQ